MDFDRSLINKTDKAFFRGIIKSEFKAGEVKVFSISPHESDIKIKDGNLLIADGSINNFVKSVMNSPIQGGGRQDHDKPNFVKKAEVKKADVKKALEVKEVVHVPIIAKVKVETRVSSAPQIQAPVEREISRMRGGGKAPSKINMFFKNEVAEGPKVLSTGTEQTIASGKADVQEPELQASGSVSSS